MSGIRKVPNSAIIKRCPDDTAEARLRKKQLQASRAIHLKVASELLTGLLSNPEVAKFDGILKKHKVGESDIMGRLIELAYLTSVKLVKKVYNGNY